MKIQEIYDALNQCLDKLESNNIDDRAKLDLEITVLQLKKQILLGVFDTLKELDNVTVADISKIPALVNQVDDVIEKEKKRVELVNQIVAIARMGLKAAGLPL